MFVKDLDACFAPLIEYVKSRYFIIDGDDTLCEGTRISECTKNAGVAADGRSR